MTWCTSNDKIRTRGRFRRDSSGLDKPETRYAAGSNFAVQILDARVRYSLQQVILNIDIVHLRRPDGRDWDGTLHVNPKLEIRGLAMIYNPLDEGITREIRLPLYYTGLSETARIQQEDGEARAYQLDRDYGAVVPVQIGAQSGTWLIVR
jgi:hypothetical protein